jgi:hypothetical protein
MRLCNRSVVLAVPFLLSALAFAGCSSGEPEGGKMDGGAMDKGKMDGGMMEKGKMDGGAMDKGKMDGSPK